VAKSVQKYEFAAGDAPCPYDITLHSTEGGSDKIYRLSIELADGDEGGFVVNYANGRRGGPMASGTRTNTPVSWAEAQKNCNKKLAEQIGKGYRPIAGTAFADNAVAVSVITRPTDTGFRPQLLSELDLGEDQSDIEKLMRSDHWALQPKHDGVRRPAQVIAGAVGGIGKKGLSVTLPRAIDQGVAKLSSNVLIDGEQVGDVLHVFDLIEIEGLDLREQPYSRRLNILEMD